MTKRGRKLIVILVILVVCSPSLYACGSESEDPSSIYSVDYFMGDYRSFLPDAAEILTIYKYVEDENIGWWEQVTFSTGTIRASGDGITYADYAMPGEQLLALPLDEDLARSINEAMALIGNSMTFKRTAVEFRDTGLNFLFEKVEHSDMPLYGFNLAITLSDPDAPDRSIRMHSGNRGDKNDPLTGAAVNLIYNREITGSDGIRYSYHLYRYFIEARVYDAYLQYQKEASKGGYAEWLSGGER